MSSLSDAVVSDFFEVAEGEGELRTQNLPSQVQRPNITDRGKKSKFKVQTRLHLCVHGYIDKTVDPKVRASLIVLEYELKCIEPNSSFTSVYTLLKFGESKDKSGTKPASLPSVKLNQPFWSSQRWNITTENIENGWNVNGTVGGGFGPATVEGTTGYQHNTSHDQIHYIEGDTGRHFNKDLQLYDQVWWNINENQSQRDGIPRNFRVAILLERSSDADFEATFALEIHAGFRYVASKVWDWCRGRAEIDDPIVFRPSEAPLGDTAGIDADHLEKVNIASLCPVWGLSVGNKKD